MLKFICLLAMVLKLKLVSGDAVCDERTLMLELRQDIADNGKLDCLRRIDAPAGVIETYQEKNNRLSAQWDSDCSFTSAQGIQNLWSLDDILRLALLAKGILRDP